MKQTDEAAEADKLKQQFFNNKALERPSSHLKLEQVVIVEKDKRTMSQKQRIAMRKQLELAS